MNRRTFNADELAKIFSFLPGGDLEMDVGNGLKLIRMAAKEKPVYTIEGRGPVHFLEAADADELRELSAIAWERGKEFIPDDPAADLTPNELKDKPEDDLLTPDELRPKPGPANLAPDPLGLTPDRLRDIIADPGLARRLATGTATAAEKVDDLLTPDELK